MTDIKFNSCNQDFVTRTFLFFIEDGYILDKAYTRKKYFLFGKTKYFVEMKYGELKYKELISKAFDNEDYLEVDRLTKEYDNIKQIQFN
jgi:hypothetical protein